MTGNLLTLLKRLCDAKVDFILIGGFAGIFHGCSYVTQDIDICLNFNTENLLRLQKSIIDLHPVHRMTPAKIKLELTCENCGQFKNIYLDTDAGQLDCISFVDGVGNFDTAKSKSTIIEIGNVKLNILDIDALIEAKKTLNRKKDAQAIVELEALRKFKKL